jgi:hypothetical protein
LDKPNEASRPEAELVSSAALKLLLSNVENIVNAAVTNAPDLGTDGLRQLLSFIAAVILEVQKSYSELLSLLLKLKFISEHDTVDSISSELWLWKYDVDRRQYRNLCDKLRNLRQAYETLVYPELLKSNIGQLEEWLDTFFKIERTRSRYLNQFEQLVDNDLYSLLKSLEKSEKGYELLREKVTTYIEELNSSLTELQQLNNKILGLSGRAGFLELVGDPKRLQQAYVSIVKDVTVVNEGSKYNVGQAGAVGDGARSDGNTFFQIPEQKKTLAESALEIQQLLKQLEQTHPTATEAEKIAYVNDETTPSFKRRVVSALQAGGEAAIEEFLDNSYVNVGKAIVKGWMKPE